MRNIIIGAGPVMLATDQSSKDYFRDLILNRYSEKDFVRNYSNIQSLKGFKDYEEFLVKKFLKGKKDILVVGCGTGRETLELAKRGFGVTGVDISKEMIKEAKAVAKKKGLEIKYLVGDISSTNLRKGKYDAVLLFNCVINQIPLHNSRVSALNNLYKSLKKRGIIICVSNNFWFPGKRFSFFIEHLKELFNILIGKKEGPFSDRVYEGDGKKVYVHLPSLRYLKKLFSRNFYIKFISSAESIVKKHKSAVFFSELLVLIGWKK